MTLALFAPELDPGRYSPIPGCDHWLASRSGKFDPIGCALADGHYSRRTPGSPQFRRSGAMGSPQFMPPGQNAERALLASGHECGPSGLITYVWVAKVRPGNPGWCYQVAGWGKTGWSADSRKRLLQKPWASAGQWPAAKREEIAGCRGRVAALAPGAATGESEGT